MPANAVKVSVVTLALAAFFVTTTQAQGRCEPAQAEAFLDINNVRARLFNNGALFWAGDGSAVYDVPQGSGINAIFTANLWVGGLVGGSIRATAARYSDYQFWPGPLNEDGTLPNRDDCSAFDRIYKVGLRDLLVYEVLGTASPDMVAWPWQHGAPVVDGDGDPNNYNLEGGDRPLVRGHQALWWVMNDAGGRRQAPSSDSQPIKLEVQATAFAARSDDALSTTTFYRYKLIYRGFEPLESAYVALYVDADLGRLDDDYTGSDSTLDLGFIYNSDNLDEGNSGYDEDPPALGVGLLQGPLVNADGQDNDGDGTTDEPDERLGMTSFKGYSDIGSVPEDPVNARQYYNFMQGRWRQGRPVTFGGSGQGFSEDPAPFMFPDDPTTAAFWSELNADGAGTARPPGDRRMVIASGPFTMQPGDEQEVVFAIVWARGDDHLASVTALKEAAGTVRAAFAEAFDTAVPATPAEAVRLGAPADGAPARPTNPTLQWEALPGSDEYHVQLATDEGFTEGLRQHFTETSLLALDDLDAQTAYYWRVRGANVSGFGPWSDVWRFSTSEGALIGGDVLRFEDGAPVFVEIAGPGGADPCSMDAIDTAGCDEAGGNGVWFSLNSTGAYSLAVPVTTPGPEERIGTRAPHDFDVRLTEEGSYGFHLFTSKRAIWVPVEVWDVGPTGPFKENDPSDDVRLIPVLYSERLTSTAECSFGYGEGLLDGRSFTDRLYAFYPVEGATYADYAALVGPLVEAHPFGCPNPSDTAPAEALIEDDSARRPLQRIVFVDNSDGATDVRDLAGTVIRFYTTDVALSAPVPAAPLNRAVSLPSTVTLWWSAPPGATAFHLQVGDRPLSTLLVNDSTRVLPTFTLDLPGAGSYYWRVRAQNAYGAWSDWSDVWAFTVGTATALDDTGSGLPTTFQLDPNYPNPFNPATTIRFGIPTPSEVRVTIYNVLGQRVATLVNDRLGAGWYTVPWQASGFSSGVYFYHLEAEGYRETRSMLLVR